MTCSCSQWFNVFVFMHLCVCVAGGVTHGSTGEMSPKVAPVHWPVAQYSGYSTGTISFQWSVAFCWLHHVIYQAAVFEEENLLRWLQMSK